MNQSLRNLLLYRVVSPHGITDLIHAQKIKDICPLIYSYGLSFGLHWILPKTVLPILFFMSSIIHFRHDFDVLSLSGEWERYLCSVSLLGLFWKGPSDLFYYYMTIVHVPQHYIRCWSFIQSSPIYTFTLLYAIGSIMESNPILLTQYPAVFQSIVVGHVLYQEYTTISSSLACIFTSLGKTLRSLMTFMQHEK